MMKPYKKLFLALLVVAFALALPAVSEELTGGPDITITQTNDAVEGLAAPVGTMLYATGEIQTAVDNAVAGSTIYLRAKKYYDNVNVKKNLNIIGRGMGYTIVDGQKLGSVFMIYEGVTATLSDMTIQNGQADGGGGVDNFGTLTLKRCELTRNTAKLGGGVVTTHMPLGMGILTVDTCNIHHNHAGTGGGIMADGANLKATLTVKNSRISYNTADTIGGGILAHNVKDATVTNSQFIGNTAHSGGAIFNRCGQYPGLDNLNVYRCNFMLNGAVGTGTDQLGNLQGHGGAIYNEDTATVTNSIFTNNFASDVNGGGAIYNAPTGTLTQSGNYFAINWPNNIAP